MKLALLTAVTALLCGLHMATATASEDTLAFNHAHSSASLQSAAITSSSAAITASLPLRDPVSAEVAPATAAIIANAPTNNSFLEASTAMIGTVGMLILVFRRRVESTA